MLCPKCGQEYEGKSCPRCEGPDIKVNMSDYEARRKAYEAKLKGEASEKAGNSTPEYKERSKKQHREEKGLGRKVNKNSKAANGIKSNSTPRDKGLVSVRKRNPFQFTKRQIKSAVISVLALLVLLAVIGIVKLALRKNYILYVSYNGKIYDVTGIDSSYVCDYADTIFASDNYTFFKKSIPDAVKDGDVVTSLASNSGKYFATVTYRDDDYVLYLWNDDIYLEVEEDARAKDIIALTDDGKLVYTNAETLDDEGTTGKITLQVASYKKAKADEQQITISKLSADVKQKFVYTEQNAVIFLDNQNQLTVYDYEKMSGSLISTDVSGLCAMTEGEQDVFSYRAGNLNEDNGADAFLYNTDGYTYYYNLDEQESFRINKSSNNSAEYIYNKKQNRFYQIVNGQLYVAKISEHNVSDFQKIGDMGKKNCYQYIETNNRLLIINAGNELVCYRTDSPEIIDTDVQDGSLTMVINKSKAFTYLKNGSQYYVADTDSKPIKISSASDLTDTTGTYYYKKRLYYYNGNGTLYSNSLKGTDEKEIGDVQRIWIGTELKRVG